jgi:hypothetical protein
MPTVHELVAPLPNTDDEEILNLFIQKLREYTVSSVCQREFVRVEQLRTWMRSEVTINGTTERVCHRLRRVCYRPYLQDHPGLPISENFILEDEGCLTAFLILISIGRGHIVHLFRRYNIIDNLPRKLAELEADLKHIGKDLRSHGSNEYKDLGDVNTLADDFDKAQWKFYPAKLSYGMDKSYAEHIILPICHWAYIHEGGIADVWQIMVQEEFVKEDLRNALPNVRFKNEQFGWVRVMAQFSFSQD